MDSDSRHSISILYIPWGKIWSTCSKPFTEETTVLWCMGPTMDSIGVRVSGYQGIRVSGYLHTMACPSLPYNTQAQAL